MANEERNTVAEKGMTIFLDVFRRADKNDDGFISWEEFVSYFADGVMSKEELQELFNQIDSHNTNNIDTEELCTYFTQHLGEFKEIFSILEDLNRKMTEVLYSTSKVYTESNFTEKFVKRFLMREILNQMCALQRPMEAASDSLDMQAREERGDVRPVEVEEVVKKPFTSGIVPGRIVRRAKRQVSAMSTGSNEGGLAMTSQVDRLSDLINRLEHKMNFDGFRDEEIVSGNDEMLLLNLREFRVKADQLEEFRAQLRAYVDVTQGFRGCLNLSVRVLKDSNAFNVYEVWSSPDTFENNNEGEANKTFVEKSSGLLESPESTRTMNIPASWWRQ